MAMETLEGLRKKVPGSGFLLVFNADGEVGCDYRLNFCRARIRCYLLWTSRRIVEKNWRFVPWILYVPFCLGVVRKVPWGFSGRGQNGRCRGSLSNNEAKLKRNPLLNPHFKRWQRFCYGGCG